MSFRGVSRELPHESLPLGEKSSENVPEMVYDLPLDFKMYSFCTCKKPAPHGSRLFRYSVFDEIEILLTNLRLEQANEMSYDTYCKQCNDDEDWGHALLQQPHAQQSQKQRNQSRNQRI